MTESETLYCANHPGPRNPAALQPLRKADLHPVRSADANRVSLQRMRARTAEEI